MDPLLPVRADHRILTRLFKMMYKSQITLTPEILDIVSKAFVLMGGSWEKIFNGDRDSIVKLKLLIQTAVNKGYIKKNKDWAENSC
jgi:hypothetical protein